MRPQTRITTATRMAEQFAKRNNPYELLLTEIRELKNELHNLSSVVAIVQREVHDTREEVRDTREEVRDTRKEFGERMNNLETEMRSSTRHSQILTASVVGVAVAAFGITAAVVYSILR